MGILLKLDCKLLSNTFHLSHRSGLYHKKNVRFSHLYLIAREFCIWLLGRLPWRFHFSKFEMWIQRPFQWALDQVCTFSSCWVWGGGHDRTWRGYLPQSGKKKKKKIWHTAKCSSLKGHRTIRHLRQKKVPILMSTVVRVLWKYRLQTTSKHNSGTLLFLLAEPRSSYRQDYHEGLSFVERDCWAKAAAGRGCREITVDQWQCQEQRSWYQRKDRKRLSRWASLHHQPTLECCGEQKETENELAVLFGSQCQPLSWGNQAVWSSPTLVWRRQDKVKSEIWKQNATEWTLACVAG